MKLKYNFRNLKWSEELVEYMDHRMRKLSKYELKPVQVNITMYAQRHERVVEVFISGRELSVQSHASADNFYDSIDKAVQRVAKQLAKKKSRIQNHKCYERTHWGKLKQSPVPEPEPWTLIDDYDDAA